MVSELVSKGKLKVAGIFRMLVKIGLIPFSAFVKIFDCQVQSCLLYGAELWGLNRVESVEKVHTSAVKRYLSVSSHTPNTMIYAETGRYPLFINSAMKCIKYWLRLVSMSNNRYTCKAYKMLRCMDENGKHCWVSVVKKFLIENGFGIVWLNQGVGNAGVFLKQLKEKLVYTYSLSWHETVLSSDRFHVYRSFKDTIMIETYIKSVDQRYLRDTYCRFRLGVSDILCHKNRYNGKDNTCPLCKIGPENERHFVMECTAYNDLRVRLIPSDVFDRGFNCMMSSQENDIIYAMCKFLHSAFRHRSLVLQPPSEADS